MYVPERTWLERGPSHYRGLGTVSPPATGIAPGSPCYDAAHDGGEVHCASLANVMLSAIPFNGPSMTTSCSDAEMACLQTAGPEVLNAPGGDPSANPLAAYATYIPWLVAGVIAVMILPAVLGRR